MNRKTKRLTGLISVIVMLLISSVSCEKENNISTYNAPADHTVNKDGVLHKSGLNQALDNCTGCHGSDLKGGTVGVSCFQCHNKKW